MFGSFPKNSEFVQHSVSDWFGTGTPAVRYKAAPLERSQGSILMLALDDSREYSAGDSQHLITARLHSFHPTRH